MKTPSTFQILLSLALAAAIVLAALPAAPVYALSGNSSAATSVVQSAAHSSAAIAPQAVVCRSVRFWHNGHWVVIRKCHHVKGHEQ